MWLNGELIKMCTPRTHLNSIIQVSKATLNAILSTHNTKFLITPPYNAHKRASSDRKDPWRIFSSILHRPYVEGLSFNKVNCIRSNISIPFNMYSRFTTLDFSHNNLTHYDINEVATFLSRCPNVKYVYLACTKINDESITPIARALESCPALLHLDLSWNTLTPEGARTLANGLKSCTKLQSLKLADNDIEEQGVDFLANVLVHCTSLSHLDLSANMVGIGGVQKSAEILRACLRLKHLDLANNTIGIYGLQVLALSCAENCALEHLDLSANYLVTARDPEPLFQNVATMVAKCPCLKYLNLSGNNIGNRFDILAPVLAHCTGLMELNLSKNDTNSGIDVLINSLQNCVYLTHLDLSNNQIMLPEAKNIGIYLHMLSHCTYLNLSSCGIAFEEADALIENEVREYSFQRLDLSYNNFEGDTIGLICMFVSKCKDLKSLDVSYNRIDPRRAKFIRKLYSNCPKISHLKATGNDLQDEYSRDTPNSSTQTNGAYHAKLLSICTTIPHVLAPDSDNMCNRR